MLIPFLKMHAQGNDFVILDFFAPESFSWAKLDFSSVAEELCKPHFGIGADGLVLLMPNASCDAQMFIYNADGTSAEMCGSALRCVTWILHQKTGKKEFSIQTEAGLKTCYVNEDNTVTVNLGIPSMLKHSYLAEGFTGDLVEIGNQHFIVWVNSLQDNPHLQYGSALEHHKGFEQTVNVHFAVLLNRKTAAIKIWEKGCGATLACGTGAAATVFSGITNGLLDNEVEVFMPGGIVKIVVSEKGYLLSGEVCRSFEGVYNWKI